MKKNRIIFYAIFAFFHLFIFGFSVYMDKGDFNFLLSLVNKIWMLKYGSLIGVVLLIVDMIWVVRGEKQHAAEKLKWDSEMTSLKAKLFDLQENEKKKGTGLPGPL